MPTVEELIKELEKFPRNSSVSCCGCNTLWIHVDSEQREVCIDCDSLDAYYEENAI